MDLLTISVDIIASIYDTTSWVAFGLSDTGGMKEADIALVSLYHNTIYDLHSQDFVLPFMDKVQNWKLLYLDTFDDHTRIQMQRDLLTCDSEDFDINQHILEHQVMMAYNLKDKLLPSTTNYKLNIMQHQYYQAKAISLFLPSTTQTAPDTYIDFMFEEDKYIHASEDTTHYFCTMFNVSEQINLIGFEPVDNTGYSTLHHANFYSCFDKEFDPTMHKCGSRYVCICLCNISNTIWLSFVIELAICFLWPPAFC